MKEFVASIRKEFLHIFRDKRTILIVMIMPVVQIILFGFAISTEVNEVRVAVCGDLSDPQVDKIVDRISHNKYLTVKPEGVVDCTGQVPLSGETFKLIGTDPRHVLFESVNSNNYLKAVVGRCVTISCTGRDINDQENYFEIERQ